MDALCLRRGRESQARLHGEKATERHKSVQAVAMSRTASGVLKSRRGAARKSLASARDYLLTMQEVHG